MRIIIDVTKNGDQSRAVVIFRRSETAGQPDVPIGRHDLTLVTAGGRRLPVSAESAGHVTELPGLLDRIEEGELQDGDVPAIGRYLFDTLLRPEWPAIIGLAPAGEPLLLGLCWPSSDDALSPLPWETMHDGHEFLATRRQNLVATTRIVTGTSAKTTVTDEVPRVLFAIGSAIDDATIRPGAELIGLLLDFERGREENGTQVGWVESRIIASASLNQLADTVSLFRPHSVHIVAHGERDPGSGNAVGIKLHDEVHTAKALSMALRWKDPITKVERLPDLVVISACESAGGGAGTAGSTFSVPLAAHLVDEGIPVVIGMAGEVGERACRLFMRSFGQSLLRGDDIATSAAHGRRAAYMGDDPPTASIDWALPTVFISAAVPMNHVAIPSPDSLVRVREVARALQLSVGRDQPVFCGRDEFFRALDDLLERRTQVLVAWAQSLSGLGERRLLRELGRRALHRGFLTVDLEDAPSGKPPATTTGLVADILRSVLITADNLGLPVFESRVLSRLGFKFSSGDDWGSLIDQASRARKLPGKDPRSVGSWLAEDFDSLLAAARSRYPEVFPEGGSVVVMMHKVHRFDKTIDALFGPQSRLIGPNGLGSARNPVPVILTTSLSDGAGIKVLDAKSHRPAGWHWEELQLFTRRRDDRQELIFPFYLWVLMNPRPGMFGTNDGAYLGDNVYAPLRSHEGWRTLLARRMTGRPADFSQPWLYDIIDFLADRQEFGRDDDEKTLGAYIETAT